jgi:predicted MFS family arabinose efflux permease
MQEEQTSGPAARGRSVNNPDAVGGQGRGLGSSGWAAVYLGVAAQTLPAVLPVMVGVLADVLGFGVVRAGYVASANLGGVALGSVICAAATRHWSWRRLIKAGAATMISANLLTTLVASFLLMALLRFGAGLGEGVMAAICYAAMSRTSQPARALAFYIAGQGLIGTVGMGVIPGIVAQAGWPWLFVLVSVVSLPAFWLARPIDTLRNGISGDLRVQSRAIPWISVLALTCMLIYFIGMSAVWALTERMGHAKSIGLGHLSIALSSSAIANMTGSLLVGILAHRLSTVTGLAAGFATTVIGLVMLTTSRHWITYLAGVSLFFFSWGVYFPFQFRLLAQVDAGGRMAVLIPLMTGGGFTLGPAVGGLLLAAGGTPLVCTFGGTCLIASTIGAAYLHFHTSGQEAADR